jgi:hypothetical protein
MIYIPHSWKYDFSIPEPKQIKCKQCCRVYYIEIGKGPNKEFCSIKCHKRYKKINQLQKFKR